MQRNKFIKRNFDQAAKHIAESLQVLELPVSQVLLATASNQISNIQTVHTFSILDSSCSHPGQDSQPANAPQPVQAVGPIVCRQQCVIDMRQVLGFQGTTNLSATVLGAQPIFPLLTCVLAVVSNTFAKRISLS